MKVLIVKTSSLGDVIHTLPALTDAQNVYPTIQFDWIIEPAFAEIPTWHASVQRVFSAPFRRWRKNIKGALQGEFQSFVKQLRMTSYDAIIDAQGLLKSALITRLAKGSRLGFNWQSAREPIASFFYQKRYQVATHQHALTRIRQLFAMALHYPLPVSPANYGLSYSHQAIENQILFLHGTTWPTKHWPQAYWQELARYATQAGFNVLLPWGNTQEYKRAQYIQQKNPKIAVLPALSLTQLARLISQVKGVVALDTGLTHLAAALNVPTLSLYGPTDRHKTGPIGLAQYPIQAPLACAPCFARTCRQAPALSLKPPCLQAIMPAQIWQQLMKMIED